jgi:hypothetical membrane protein
MILTAISDAFGRVVDGTPAWVLTVALLLAGLLLLHFAVNKRTASKRKAVKALV